MKERIDVSGSMDTIRCAARRASLAIWLLWLLGPSGGWAQSKQADSTGRAPVAATARDDRAPIRVRFPDAEHLRDKQTDHDYQYANEAPPPENPLARFWYWLVTKIGRLLASKAYQNVWQYVLLAAIAGLAVYLLMKAEVIRFLFPGKAQSANLAYENLDENIHEIDFDTAVDEAISQRNFRLAVRLLYLQTLKHLSDAGRIRYRPEKTNRQYISELTPSSLQTNFSALTRQFEFTWYGNFPIDETRFLALQNEFKTFNRASKLLTT